MSAKKNSPATPGEASAARPAAPRNPLPDINKHRAMCSICRHPQLHDIEDDFLDWASPRQIARTYTLPSHTTVYRHAYVIGLLYRRRRNLQRSLDYIVEHASEVKPSASAIVSAVRLAAEINSQGEWFEPGEKVYTKELFDRMSPEELDDYAVKGVLPEWFRKAIGKDVQDLKLRTDREEQPPQARPTGEGNGKARS